MTDTTDDTDREAAEAGSFTELPPTPMRAFQRLGGWRVLRSMRTAIYLLIALTAATLVPTFVPQRINNAQKVLEIRRTHPYWYSVGERLKVFDVFTSPWYMAIWVSLLVVLFLCLLPRTAAFFRQWRRALAEPHSGALPNLPHVTEWQTSLSPGDAARAARRTLRRRRWRQGRANPSGQYVAEKGALREAGSLLFHWSLFLLIIGLAVSRFLGFAGQAVIVEGKEWVEAPINFDSWRNKGSLGDSAHRGFTVALDSFVVDDPQTDAPQDFVSTVRVIDGGREVAEKRIAPNDPLNYRGVKMYQLSFGWAAQIRVVDADGRTVFDDFVILRPEGPRGSWTGVVKVPSLQPQAGLAVYLFPTAEQITPSQAEALGEDELGPRVLLRNRPGAPMADNPAILFREWRGDLGLEAGPQSVYNLDTAAMTETDAGLVTLDSNGFTLEDGLRVEFPELRHYSVFDVKRDPGLAFVLVSAVLLLLGLVGALYSRRRRLWVWVRPAPEGADRTLVTFGGLGYQRKEVFADEFGGLVATLREALPPIDSVAPPHEPRPDTESSPIESRS